jgi:peptidoglycan biosynthesis protein MviN/MurJ (putative lipid II flippase)
MHSVNLICHEFVVAVSFVACIAGLLLLYGSKQQKNEWEETERILLRMSFTYWLVYCVAFGIEKVILPEWSAVVMSLRMTTALSYLLTFSCILSLPLHKFAVHEVEE